MRGDFGRPAKVYTGGTFDLLHWGHVQFLQKCAQLGEVTVALNTDEFIKQYKGKSPVMTYDERDKMLRALECVHSVMPNRSGADSRDTIELVKPNIIAIGSDWATKDYYKQMGFDQQWLDDRDIWLVYIPYTKGISSTEIKSRLSDGQVF